MIMRRGLQDGLILLGGGPHGNVLSFSPPFVVTEEEIAFLAEKLEGYLQLPVGDAAGIVNLSEKQT
jgi:4-aminobutyrate aminotransferase-like enzyme